MDNSPHIFFMGPQALQDRFWTEQAKTRAAELGYEVRLNTLPGKLAAGEWVEQLVDHGAQGRNIVAGEGLLDILEFFACHVWRR